MSVNTVHWFDACCSGTPVNNSITLISPVQSLGYIFAAGSICAALQISEGRTDGQTDGRTDRQADISALAIPALA